MKRSIDIFNARGLEWKKNHAVIDGSTLSGHWIETREVSTDSHAIGMYSDRTNVILYFYPVFDEDGFDGEFKVYKTDGGKFTVTVWNY